MNEERLAISDLYIAPKTYSMRKEQMALRFNTMVEYADNSSTCRSVVIQNYFGDTSAEPCGCCDICLAKRKGVKVEQVEKQIRELLAERSYTLREIASSVSLPQQKISAALTNMAERGVITISDAGDVALVSDGGSEK